MLVDAHTHLHMYGDDEVAGVLEEIDRNSIRTIAVSMDFQSFRTTEEIAASSDLVSAAFGIHPELAPDHVDALGDVTEVSRGSPILGEIGLDHRFVTDRACYGPQRVVFEHFLRLAADQGKLVNLHTAGAEHEVADLLEIHGIRRAIVHWYSGPLDALDRLIGLGCLFTIGPAVALSEHIRRIARAVPDELLLTETDSPGGPEWLGLGKGRPAMVEEVVDTLAAIRKVDRDGVVNTIADNFARLLGGR